MAINAQNIHVDLQKKSDHNGMSSLQPIIYGLDEGQYQYRTKLVRMGEHGTSSLSQGGFISCKSNCRHALGDVRINLVDGDQCTVTIVVSDHDGVVFQKDIIC